MQRTETGTIHRAPKIRSVMGKLALLVSAGVAITVLGAGTASAESDGDRIERALARGLVYTVLGIQHDLVFGNYDHGRTVRHYVGDRCGRQHRAHYKRHERHARNKHASHKWSRHARHDHGRRAHGHRGHAHDWRAKKAHKRHQRRHDEKHARRGNERTRRDDHRDNDRRDDDRRGRDRDRGRIAYSH